MTSRARSAQPTAADVLRAGLELIPDEQHWTKRAFARVGTYPVTGLVELYAAYRNGTATSFCPQGALYVARLRLGAGFEAIVTAGALLACEQGSADIVSSNDRPETTYAMVRGAFERAIAEAEKGAAA